MTVLNGPIVFNSISGNDTQASGLGPTDALYGSTASITSGSATVTGIDTTNVLSGDLLWVKSSTGRQFSVIQTVVSSSEVLCDDNFDVTETGRTWAIGGKRKTFDNADSRFVFSDRMDNSRYVGIKTETDQTVTGSTITVNSYSPTTIKKIYSDDLRTILADVTSTTYGAFLTGQTQYVIWENLKFLTTRTTPSQRAVMGGYAGLIKCVIGEEGASNNFAFGIRGEFYGHRVFAKDCTFYGPGADYTATVGGAIGGGHYNGTTTYVANCMIKDWPYGVYAYPGGARAFDTVITDCDVGVYYNTANSDAIFKGCIFNNLGIGIDFTGSLPRDFLAFGVNITGSSSIFSNISGDIIRSGSTAELERFPPTPQQIYAYNCPGGFTNIPSSVTKVDLAVDPFVDSIGRDFNLNREPGGGLTLRNSNFKVGE